MKLFKRRINVGLDITDQFFRKESLHIKWQLDRGIKYFLN